MDHNNPDSDGDGTPDCDERTYQTFTHTAKAEESAVEEVTVALEGTGNLQNTTSVESIMNVDILCSGVVGLVGELFEIETTSQFDTATITFRIDKSRLGDTKFDNLMFLWYDEENDMFVEMETILDEQNSTASVVTSHFSRYMLVDKAEWFEAWQKDIYADIPDNAPQNRDTVFCLTILPPQTHRTLTRATSGPLYIIILRQLIVTKELPFLLMTFR